MSKQEKNVAGKKGSLYEQEGALQLEFSMAVAGTPVNITNVRQFVLEAGLSHIDDLSKVPLPLVRGQKLAVVQHLLEKRKERSEDLLKFLFQAAIDKTLEAINRNIEFWQEQMELMLVKMAEQQDFLEILYCSDTALYESVLEYQKTGKLSRETTGELTNKDAHAALVDYLQENHLPEYNTSTDAELYVLMLEARVDVELQSQAANQKVGELTENYEQYKINTERSVIIKEDLESGDPIRQQAGLMAYYQLEKHVQLDIDQQITNSPNHVQQEVDEQLEQDNRTEDVLIIDILDKVEPFEDHDGLKKDPSLTIPKL